MTEQELIQHLGSVDEITVHTNGMRKAFSEIELDKNDILMLVLHIKSHDGISRRVKIVGKVNGTGKTKAGIGSLSFRPYDMKKDSFRIDD